MKDFAVSANLLKVSKYLLNSRFENEKKVMMKKRSLNTNISSSCWKVFEMPMMFLGTICATQTWFSYALSYFERQKVVKI